MEPQSANLRIQKEKPEMVRPAQSRQHSDSLHSSRPVSAKQVRQRASSKQQQQLSLSHTAAAMDAQSPSGMPVPGAQQQSINPASRYPLAELMSAYPAEQGRQLRGAGLYEEALGDDMCGPIELTWEGVLQAASASDQPPHQPGLPVLSSGLASVPCTCWCPCQATHKGNTVWNVEYATM